uniref:Uncharacterized protein n=1 Tax=Panagrolaimus superbus TaxID=310955 RepID=A0A914YS08_9BILA
MLAYWRPEGIILFNAQTMFIIGIFSFILTFLYALVECFICVDRCISVIFPTVYSKGFQIVFMLIGFGFIAFTAFLFYGTTSPFYPPSPAATTCLFFACMVAKSSYLLIKGCTVVAGFTASMILAFLIKYKFNAANKSATKINRTVITNVSIALYAGPFIYTISLVTGAIIAGKYCKTFVKVFGVSNTVSYFT